MYSEELRLCSKSETAKLLSIGKSAVSDLIFLGRLGFIQIGKRQLIPLCEIRRFLAESLNLLSVPSEAEDDASGSFDSVQFIDNLINNKH